MIPVRAPCPVCFQPVKVESYHGTFWVGCVGQGKHSFEMFGYARPEEAAREWDRLFESNGGEHQ